MIQSQRIALQASLFVISLILHMTGVQQAGAQPAASDPQAAVSADQTPPAAAAPVPAGNFLSTLKQAFRQDLENDVVRGHFDIGTPPDSHRYYCMVDPKTGQREENGVGGKPFIRRDGMTGIKSGAVAFYSCVDAERQGLLMTSGYVLSPAANAAMARTAARVAPVAPVAAAAPPPAPFVAAAKAPGSSELDLADIKATYARFIDGQNAHDPDIVTSVLLDSSDFVWAQSGGTSIWSRRNAMLAFENDWKGTWKMESRSGELRIAGIAPGVAILITPILLTQGASGEVPSTTPIRWAGVFVKTAAGWRLASILMTPHPAWRPVE